MPHQVEYYLGLLTGLGIKAQVRRGEMFFRPADEAAVARLLAGCGVKEGATLVAVHPGAVRPEKRWPAERFAAVAKWLVEECAAWVVLLGTPGEAGLLDEIVRMAEAKGRVLALPGLNLKQAAALLKRARLFVGNDSGLMHLAAVLDVPLVAVFGPGAPWLTGPWTSAPYQVVLEEFPCRPCRQRFFAECQPASSGKPPCLEAVGVEKVVQAAFAVLEQE